MDGYSLMEKMRKARRRFRFTATEQALFYELVAICNGEDWRNVFECSNIELCNALNINKNTLIRARETLINAELLHYQSGKSRREVSSYSFMLPFEKQKSGLNFKPDAGTDAGTDTGTDTGTDNRHLYKTKTKEKDVSKDTSKKKVEIINSADVECEVKNWRSDFGVYLADLKLAYEAATEDDEFISELERYHPELNIRLSLEKAYLWYWVTEAAWKKKKASKTQQIDWKTTLRNAIDVKCNHVWLQKRQTNGKEKEEAGSRMPGYYKQPWEDYAPSEQD